MARTVLPALLLALVPLVSPAKTKLLVDDPNNLVVARFALNRAQRQDALAAADGLLRRDRDRPYTGALRYVAVEVGPLTPRQERREPGQERKARRRLARYEIPFGPGPVRTVVLYDVQRRRILHDRLYALHAVPPPGWVGRVDDDVALFFGPTASDEKQLRSK